MCKNDEHPQGKGGETKVVRQKKPGTRNLFDCVARGEHAAWIILFQPTERRRGILEPPFCRRANAVFESNRNRMVRSTRFQGGDHHRLRASGHRERVMSSRLVLRWKETDTGYKAKARWCVHGFFKDPDIHEIERCCPTPELSSINITLQILASSTSEGTLADGKRAFMQGDPTVRDEPLKATTPPEGLPGVPEGALIRLDREVCGLVSGMSGWRSRIVFPLERGRLQDECV